MIGKQIPMQVLSLAGETKINPLRAALSLIERHATIGAKVASGYGAIRIYEGGGFLQVNPSIIAELAAQAQPGQNLARNNVLPDIRDFFFAKLQFDEPQSANWWLRIEGIKQAWAASVTDRSFTPSLTQSLPRVRKELQQVFDNDCVPLAPAMRNWLRYYWRSTFNDGQKYYLFGEASSVCPRCYKPGYRDDQRDRNKNWCGHCRSAFPKGQEHPAMASKVNISHAYRLDNRVWEFRLWGWLPCRMPAYVGLQRDTFLTDLHTALGNTAIWHWLFGGRTPSPRLVEWEALDCQQRDGYAYLKRLLGLN
jgi:CRISPR-associated protein Cmr1